VTSFRHGHEVYGMTGGVGGLHGSLAEYAVVEADLLAPKPANLTVALVLGAAFAAVGCLMSSLRLIAKAQ
jgi:NADPH:quinone reductase-like Zn-dependent oxidoreductase